MSVRLSLTLLACASALALSACKDDSQPQAAAYDFASAPPAVVEVNAPANYDGYALAERAHAFDRATSRSTPSYGFRYGEEEPWAWRTVDDYSMYAEPYDDGYRSYYYEPGADYPYFVRDDDYGYGYGPDGALIAVYDASGVRLPEDRLYALALVAGTYLVRASAIRRYALDDRYRVYVSDDYWTARAPRYYQTRQVWYSAPERQPQWRAWRANHEHEISRFVPRGEVRRWSRADDRAWRTYEQADRRAWKVEDQAWRKADRQVDRQVASAAPPLAAPPRAIRDDRRDRSEDRRTDRRDEPRTRQAMAEAPRAPDRPDKADRRIVSAAPPLAAPPRAMRDDRRDRSEDRKVDRRDEPRVRQAMAEAPRAPERSDKAARKPDRVQVATTQPRRAPDVSARRSDEQRPEPPHAAPREHGGNQQAQAPAPPRQQPPRPVAERHAPDAGGKPAPAPQGKPNGKGGGKPDNGEGKGRGKE